MGGVTTNLNQEGKALRILGDATYFGPALGLRDSLATRPVCHALLLLLLLIGSAVSAGPADAQPQFSVMTLPPTAGSDQTQLAVKWSGTLPAKLELGHQDDAGGFTALTSGIRVNEAMSLLPQPHVSVAAGVDLVWRASDEQGQTLAQTAGASPGFGWQPGFEGLDLDGPVRATTIFEGDLIVAGSFKLAGEVVANHIARWDGSVWTAFSGPTGTGMNASVYALCVYNGELIAAGDFVQAGGVSVSRIARWDGSAWAALSGPLGTGLNNRADALTVYNGELIVGGLFTQAGGVTVNRIARWNGSAWAALSGPSGTGVNDSGVHALTVYNGDLIVGGEFTQAGGVTVNRIARWNGSAWGALSGPSGTGVSGQVLALTVYNGELIAGGSFVRAGDLTVNRIARWDGTTWATLSGPSGTGVEGFVSTLSVHNGDLIAGGFFREAGGVTVENIARWNGSVWTDSSGLLSPDSNHIVYALSIYNGELIAGGAFREAGGVTVSNIARWNGSTWASMSEPNRTGVEGDLRASTVYNGELIVGGNFTTAGGRAVNGIARWDGSAWSTLGSPTGIVGGAEIVYALGVYNGELIAGGSFTHAGGVTVDNIARWNGSDWASLAGPVYNGVSGEVYALSVYNGELIAGGVFHRAGGVTVNDIARWNGSSWAALSGPLGTGVEGLVYALSVYNGELIAGGRFFNAGGVTVNHIARWNGGAWSALGSPPGISGNGEGIYALSVYNGGLIAGGRFSRAGGMTVNHIARWNGSAWAAAGIYPWGEPGTNGVVRVLRVYNDELVVGGDFSTAGNVWAGRIARWDGGGWSALSGPSGDGVNNRVRTLSVYDNELIVGGEFTLAGGIPSSRIGRYISPHTVGGQVRGLAGATLVLQNNGGDDLFLNLNGSFTFSTPLADGSHYAVTVATQPTSPSQTCTVSNGSGSLAGANVNNVAVNCATNRFTVGGLLSGLAPGAVVVLENNGSDHLILEADGAFTFATALVDLSGYEVMVTTQPTNPNQTCTIINGSGNLAGANVLDISVNCVTDTYTVIPSATAGGSIEPSSLQTVMHGDTSVFALNAEAGFFLSEVLGSCGGSLNGTVYTTEPITVDCSVQAQYLPQVTSITTLEANSNPVSLGESLSFLVEVNGASAPTDGIVTVSASSGESCIDSTPPQVSGNAARFSCDLSFSNLGPRVVIASFSDSVTHADSSSAPLNFSVARFADLSATISDGLDTVMPGQSLSYLIEVRNAGPDEAPASVIVVASTPQLLNTDWICFPIGTAVCPKTGGSGELGAQFDLPASSGLDFIQSGVAPNALNGPLIVNVSLVGSALAPNFVFDPQSDNNQDVDVNLLDQLFSDGFE